MSETVGVVKSRYSVGRRMVATGMTIDQKNAIYILEAVLFRRNYSSQTRDNLADHLERIREGDDLTKKTKPEKAKQ